MSMIEPSEILAGLSQMDSARCKIDCTTGVIDEELIEYTNNDDDTFGESEMQSYETKIKIRDWYIQHFGYAAVTEKFVNGMAEWIKMRTTKPILSVMSGSCTLEKNLISKGIEIICTDIGGWGRRIGSLYSLWEKTSGQMFEKIRAADAIMKYGNDVDYVLCSWPPYGEHHTSNLLKIMQLKYPHLIMIYIGEEFGGCTADDIFFEIGTDITASDPDFERLVYGTYRSLASITHDRPMLYR